MIFDYLHISEKLTTEIADIYIIIALQISHECNLWIGLSLTTFSWELTLLFGMAVEAIVGCGVLKK